MRWVGLFSKSNLIKTTANRLSYELGVNGEKKINGNCDVINKNGHLFHLIHTCKPGNFNGLRDINLIWWYCYL